MIAPSVVLGSENPHRFTTGANGSNIGALQAVAHQAGQREVLERRRSPVLAADHVINLMSKRGVIGMNQAVFTSEPSPLSHLRPKVSRYRH